MLHDVRMTPPSTHAHRLRDRVVRHAGALAVAGGVVASLVVAVSEAEAAAPGIDCAAVVVDRAGILDDQRVQRAASRVIDEAADVRVMTFTSVPGADLDAAVTSVWRSCDLWSDDDKSLNDNMIVLAVSVKDRRSGLYYGASWRRQLLSSWPRIQANAMNPAFKREDWTGGMVAGLRGVARQLDTTPGANDGQDGGPYQDGDDIPYVDPYADSDLNGLGGTDSSSAFAIPVLVGILGIGGLVAAIALGGGGGAMRRGRGRVGAGTGFLGGYMAGSLRNQHHHHDSGGFGGGSMGGGGSGSGGDSGGGAGDGGGSSSF